jgi:hypothetical protein
VHGPQQRLLPNRLGGRLLSGEELNQDEQNGGNDRSDSEMITHRTLLDMFSGDMLCETAGADKENARAEGSPACPRGISGDVLNPGRSSDTLSF